MTILFLVLIVAACVALGFVVLIQNPKGGVLSSNVGGISNQFMGVKQTTDVLEKGTWLFAAIIAILALLSTLFLKGGSSAASEDSILQKHLRNRQEHYETINYLRNKHNLPIGYLI